MTRLNEVVAAIKNVKARTYARLTELHKTSQKPQLYAGLSRTYRPTDHEGVQLPPEFAKVQLRAEDVLLELAKITSPLWDITATQEIGNNRALADVVVNDEVLLRDVPPAVLLFLEKQLTDVRTVISNLPTLDPGETWDYNSSQDGFATAPVETKSTKKVPRNHVVAVATDRHPAQVQVYQENIVVGFWSTIKFSGALPVSRQRQLLDRADALIDGVKKARERANLIEVTNVPIAEALFEFLLSVD